MSSYAFVLVNLNETSEEELSYISEVALQDFQASGVEEFSLEEETVDQFLGDRAYSGGDVTIDLIEEIEMKSREHQFSVFKFYFSHEGYEAHSENFYEWLKLNFPNLSVKREILKSEDWNQEWKKYYMPITISDQLMVVPEWLESEVQFSGKKLMIYPGMGFGTGTHETTFLCLKLFEKYIATADRAQNNTGNSKVLDFGSGSGILGIGAIHRINAEVDFVDIDPKALDNSLKNLKINFDLNSLSGSSLILRERFQFHKTYDLVFANILENVLLLEANHLTSAVSEGGHLIVSGLLNHQVDTVVNSYRKVTEQKFTAVEILSKGDWSAIIFQHTPKSVLEKKA